MGLSSTPKRPVGTTPGKSFVDGGDPYGIKLGVIFRVDEINMKADIKVLTGGGTRLEVDLTQGMVGPRSFWGGVPELNSLVLLGYRRRSKDLREACILGYIPTANRLGLRFDPFSPVGPTEVAPEDIADFEAVMGKTYRRKRLKLSPGDVGGMSASGAELVLAKDIRMVNRAGDLLELRDNDRTLVSQAIHLVEAESGVHRLAGPIRRGAYWLPTDIFREDGRTLKDESEKYYGRDDLQAAGPGMGTGGPTKFSNTEGKVLDVINNSEEIPPVCYSNGRRVQYPATNPGINFEDAEIGFGAEAYVEHRTELYHTSDLSQEVLEEIDGFQLEHRAPYIEHVMGTIVGNDAYSGAGQRRYAKILKPKVFDEFWQTGRGSFALEEIQRSPNEDIEKDTLAGAYMVKVQPPFGAADTCYAVVVNKQGKLFANIPGSTVESYAAATNISVEANLDGALKMFIGAMRPDNVSAHIYCEGAVLWEVGHAKGAPGGTGFTIRSHSGLSIESSGPPDDDDNGYMESVQGNKTILCTGSSTEQVQGSKAVTVNGASSHIADRIQVQASQGYGGNYGDYSLLVSGKTIANYALQYMETVVAGGKVETVLAGAVTETIAAGAMTTTVAAGAIAINCPAGAYTITVGTGAISCTTSAGAVTLSTASGAMSLSAGAGAITITAGLALTLTASTVCSITAPMIQLGGPAAVFGVARGYPMMPPGSPSLDWVTGQQLQGCTVVTSI